VIVLESDGSVLLSLFNLPTVAAMNPANLAIFIFDNQAYSGTKISEPTATAGRTDLAGMARSAGIEHAVTVREIASFKNEVVGAIGESKLKFVVAKSKSRCHRKIERTHVDLLESKYRFVRYLERTEGKAIFRGGDRL
jgi:thiamine pyrophosphate-dependent acetolactate synthase large subunit-like protein